MRAMNDVINLICVKTAKRVNGIPQTETAGTTEVFANISSVKRNEYYAADREGVKLALSVYVNVEDFETAAVKDGEKKIMPSKVEYDGTVYRIYRTYRESDTTMELILQEAE